MPLEDESIFESALCAHKYRGIDTMIRLVKAFLVISIILLSTSTCLADRSLQVDSEDALVVEGVIARGNLVSLGQELLKRASDGATKVDMIINSPGGSVIDGFLFINVMEAAKAKGLYIRCFVPEIAASMAFGLLVHCNERHTLARSFLLWHRARISAGFGTVLTATEMLKLGSDLARVDQLILDEVTAAMPDVNPEVISYHFESETLHVGTNLHKLSPIFITSHKTIEGLYDTMSSKSVPRNGSSSPFTFVEAHQWEEGEIIYISKRAGAAGGQDK